MSPRHVSALVLSGVLAGCIAILSRDLRVDSDLGQFLPRTEDPIASLLIDELREGTGARGLLIAISGAPRERLATLSRQLRDILSRDRRILRIHNGSQDLDAELRDWLIENRYRLVALAPDAFSAENLRRALHERLAELAANTAVLRPIEVSRDPTAVSLAALRRVAPAVQPERHHGVWMSLDEARALLFAELAHGGYAIDEQQALLAHIRARFDELAGPSPHLAMSGSAAFAAAARESVTAESRQLSLLASLGVGLILWLSFRSLRVVVLATLPVASGVAVAVTTVVVLFGSIHGITLAFGITLLGVALDYPIHLFSHATQSARGDYGHIWPTLGLGLLTTSLGYCILLLSDFSGLVQLGVFAITGLCAAFAVTRWVLPHWIARVTTAACSDKGRRVSRVEIPRPARLLIWLGGAGLVLAAILDPRPWLESDIAALSPVPAAGKEFDRELRTALGAPEAGHVVYVDGNSVQTVLERQERLLPVLESARGQGELDGFEAAAYLLPSIAAQTERVARLPDGDTLRAALSEATRDLPLSPSRFEPFVADIEAMRTASPLLRDDDGAAPLAARLAGLLRVRDDTWYGPIVLIGLRNPDALAQRIESLGVDGVRFLDLRATSSRIMDRFMSEALKHAMGLASLIAVVLVLTQRRGAQIGAAVLLSLAGAVALLHLAGEVLSIFHVIGLLLVLGIGLDYGLFGARTPAAERAGTRHALRTCWLSTLSVFALLSSSEIPVLNALGLTVAIGVSHCYLVNAVLFAPPRESQDGHHA